MKRMRALRGVVVILCLAAGPATGEIFVRWNQAGYRPERPKTVVVMSDDDLTGHAWTLTISTNPGEPLLRGEIGASTTGIGPHTPFAFNHRIDLSILREPGEYRLSVADVQSVAIRVDADPHRALATQALRHLRFARSGSGHTVMRRFSHPGDARAPLWVPDGDPSHGRWKPVEPARTVDALGGWYDAGDQIKFTLNNAYTVYHLLLAHRLAPDFFETVNSPSSLPDVLDEARHGLAYLLRVHPEPDVFIVQVADERDHDQPLRLPENDALDGRRPALCALSRVHMGAASAALALGARTFRELGDVEFAAECEHAARTIYARARQSDTIVTAFERGEVNDFYRDPIDEDQMALAAAELFALTGERHYLDAAIELAPRPAGEVGWGDWHWLANAGLAPHDPAAAQRLAAEVDRYVARSRGEGAPWGVPGPYVWASLHRWIGAANAARFANRILPRTVERDTLFLDMLDYTYGRSSWGVSFQFSKDLPNTVRNIYSPAYHLLNAFPTGALSEGPGNRAMHESLARWFDQAEAGHPLPVDLSVGRFDTEAGVFADSAADFMCQESTISGQADLVLMLTLASVD